MAAAAKAPRGYRDPGEMSLMEQQQEFAELANEEDRLEVALDRIKKRKAVLDPIIREGMIEADQQHARFHGRTIAIHRQLWASARIDRAEAAQVLIDVGLADLVAPNFNVNTISAVFRNWDKADQDGVLSAEDAARRAALLESAFSVGEKFSLRATK